MHKCTSVQERVILKLHSSNEPVLGWKADAVTCQ